jgi:hypothetical protein
MSIKPKPYCTCNILERTKGYDITQIKFNPPRKRYLYLDAIVYLGAAALNFP